MRLKRLRLQAARLGWLGLLAVTVSCPGGEVDIAGSVRPGNVYLEGEPVLARLPERLPPEAVSWRLVDDRREEVAAGALEEFPEGARASVPVGKQGIGWYRVEVLDKDGSPLAWTTAAVLARLRAPVPEDTPIAVDAATAWFARDDRTAQEEFARLAALAGVRWVRDRLHWRELEPSEGTLAPEGNTYDLSAEVQSRAGLSILQVFHDTPEWAVDRELDGDRARGRFARDLRHIYRFSLEAGRRFRGRVQAWEPWNEANVRDFGGHTVDEMCSWQKASFLGFRAADPDLIVGWNAYTAPPTDLHADGVILNETWPYFDTYNVHSYDWADSYAELWGPTRRAACGRPIWVTEADRGMKYTGDRPWCELSREGEIHKAEYLAQEYASSLFAGARVHFHFILGHYTEDRNGVQFGLLRLDRTPRPSYVALAALGRFLAGARCLGRWRVPESPAARVYAFRAVPDGRTRDVLVAWHQESGEWEARSGGESPWELPRSVTPDGGYDYLGRSLDAGVPEKLRPAPIFLVLPEGASEGLPLESPPSPGPVRGGDASPIVLQLQLPRSRVRKIEGQGWSHGYEYTVKAGEKVELPIFVTNFSDKPASGSIRVEDFPEGARLDPQRWDVSVPSMERTRILATYRQPEKPSGSTENSWIRLRGAFRSLGEPVLAFRLAVR